MSAPTDVEVEEIVARIAAAHPDGVSPIITKAMAEALVHRDVLDHTRKETAGALNISTYSVDDRTRDGRGKVEAVAELARVLLDVGLLDVDLVVPRSERRAESTDGSAQEADQEADADDATAESDAPSDGSATPWERIMATGVVTGIKRSADGTATSITVKDADEEDVETITAALGDLGLALYGSTDFGESGVSTIRARRAEPEDDTLTCHYCGEEFAVDDDAPWLVRSWNSGDPDHPACGDCLGDVVTGADLVPLPEFRDDVEADQEADADDAPEVEEPPAVEEAAQSAQSETSPDATETSDASDGAQEGAEGYVCEDCGRTFPSGGALGGHRGHCEARAARLAAE